MNNRMPCSATAVERQRDAAQSRHDADAPSSEERADFKADWIARVLATAKQQSITRQQAAFLNEIFDEATAGRGCELLTLKAHDERAYVERIDALIHAYLLPHAERACDDYDWSEFRRLTEADELYRQAELEE